MIKNKTAQLVYQTIYCVLGIFGLLNSVGFFEANFNENFYVYYTNLSNYICLGFMLVCLIKTYRQVKQGNKADLYVSPMFHFMCVILILVTFLVYNLLLADEHTFVTYITTQSNILMHAILPVMFILYWILFGKHPTLKWYHPLLSIVMPLVYVIFIVIRAIPMKNVPGALLYPYFFLDIDTLGWGGFLTWVGVLLAVFIVIGYLLYLVDKMVLKKKQQ